MTKSFTALAILKLRDEGKLSLEDPVSKWIPEFARMELPTRDTPPLRVRQLLSHSAGFPEDNPWGDQQLSATDADARCVAARRHSVLDAAGHALRVFQLRLRPARPHRDQGIRRAVRAYLRDRDPVEAAAWTARRFEFSEVPAARRAIGYRLKPDGTYAEEPPLPHGVFGAMGGLLTTATDLGSTWRFICRRGRRATMPEAGPVNRASVREMAHLWTPSNLTARVVNGAMQASESGYGFGLARRLGLPLRTHRGAWRRVAGLRFVHGSGCPTTASACSRWRR